MTIKISDYQSRPDLETHIKNTHGEDIAANRLAGHTIEGTEAELANFGLSTSTTVYGIQVSIKN